MLKITFGNKIKGKFSLKISASSKTKDFSKKHSPPALHKIEDKIEPQIIVANNIKDKRKLQITVSIRLSKKSLDFVATNQFKGILQISEQFCFKNTAGGLGLAVEPENGRKSSLKMRGGIEIG